MDYSSMKISHYQHESFGVLNIGCQKLFQFGSSMNHIHVLEDVQNGLLKSNHKKGQWFSISDVTTHSN